MIYITLNYTDSTTETVQGHADTRHGRFGLRHLLEKKQLSRLESAEVQADEHELEVLLAHFQNLPRCNNRVQLWHGEFARFIVNNLP